MVQLTAAVDTDFNDILIEWITRHPGVDVLKFNKKDILLTIPEIYLNSFWRLGISKNGKNFLERQLIDSSHDFRYVLICPFLTFNKLMNNFQS